MDMPIRTPDTIQPLAPKGAQRFWAFGVFAALVVLTGFGLSAPGTFPKSGSIFTIQQGRSLSGVAQDLNREHYVRSSLMFSTLVTLLGGEHRISPGDYYFKQGEGTFSLARQIAKGDHNLVPIKVTIPEGERVSGLTALLVAKLPAFDAKSFATLAKPDEGYLFPETYFWYPKTTQEEIVRDMRAMFDKQTSALFDKPLTSGRTKAAIVTMASLVEREAHGADDRGTIAGILYKRISLGMRLQVDATVAFAADKSDASLTKADFSIDSPYNTYTHAGLPPGPIASPGQEAIKAAIDPVDTPYLYYLHDKNGSIHYAKTYAEHLKNIAAYLK
jgi:UPF0755 protein